MKILLAVAIASGVAQAAPADLIEVDQHTLGAFLDTALIPVDAEPGGWTVPNRSDWTKLGLKPKDVLRTINGRIPGYLPVIVEGRYVIELERAGKPMVVRIVVHGEAQRTIDLDEDDLKTALVRMRESAAERLAPGLTLRGGKGPSGVVIATEAWLYAFRIVAGDIVRTVGGTHVTTADELMAAADKLADGSQLVFERDGRAITETLHVAPAVAAVDLTQIKKLAENRYELPRSFVDAVLANPMAVGKGARVVPAMKDGKPTGFKLYAIRPASVFAALGFQNGDTLVSVNGFDLTSADKALEVYVKLREATHLEVDIIRRGKPMKLTYTIR